MTRESDARETIKSAIIGVAAAVALICWLKFQPAQPEERPQERIGKKLLERFDDPAAVSRIEFTGVDPATGDPRQLVLTREGEEWRLPALSGFPAENATKLAKVVAPLVQLTTLSVVDGTDSDDAKKVAKLHRECGLLNPSGFVPDPDAELRADGEGERPDLSRGAALEIKIDGASGERLVDLLVGDRVPESSATRDDRFVRFPNDDVVCTADFSGESTLEAGADDFDEFPNRVSFNPIDWIDPDLLRISRWDALFMTIRDYSCKIETAENGAPEIAEFSPRCVAVFRQTPENSLSRVWSLSTLLERNQNSWKAVENVDPEKANNDALNETIDALCKLQIVDVRAKPEALATLFEQDRLGAELAQHSAVLAQLGFAVHDFDPLRPDKVEPALVGEGGEIDVATKSGIRISVVFGRAFEGKRACIATASFDESVLDQSAEDAAERAFLAADAEPKARLKNNRFAKWFYFIDDAGWQKLKFRRTETIAE